MIDRSSVEDQAVEAVFQPKRRFSIVWIVPLVAGAGLCNPQTTRFIVEHSRAAIDWLIELGVPFTRDGDDSDGVSYQGFHLTREGGHSHRRIIHAADATGEAVTTTLGPKVIG